MVVETPFPEVVDFFNNLDESWDFDLFLAFDELDKAKKFAELLKESLDGEGASVEIYTQVDTDTGDRVYLRGIHFVNRTGVYAVGMKFDGRPKYVELGCPTCKNPFKVLTSYGAVITCPYCGELVED